MSKKLAVVFSGAGLSAESGIPTFRDSNGLWENHEVSDVASPEGWERNKQLVLDFYGQRFKSVNSVQPNPAHKAIAALEEKYNVINLTQNIDDLLERAGCTNVQHIHGSILKGRCEKHKWGSMLDGDINYTCDYETTLTEDIKLGDLCPKCSGQMRPDVVWFGEAVYFDFEKVRDYVREVKYNDGVFICVGTSGQVQPAASMIPLFAQVKNKHIVDLNARKIADYTLHVGPAGEMLPKLVETLLA